MKKKDEGRIVEEGQVHKRGKSRVLFGKEGIIEQYRKREEDALLSFFSICVYSFLGV